MAKQPEARVMQHTTLADVCGGKHLPYRTDWNQTLDVHSLSAVEPTCKHEVRHVHAREHAPYMTMTTALTCNGDIEELQVWRGWAITPHFV